LIYLIIVNISKTFETFNETSVKQENYSVRITITSKIIRALSRRVFSLTSDYGISIAHKPIFTFFFVHSNILQYPRPHVSI